LAVVSAFALNVAMAVAKKYEQTLLPNKQDDPAVKGE